MLFRSLVVWPPIQSNVPRRGQDPQNWLPNSQVLGWLLIIISEYGDLQESEAHSPEPESAAGATGASSQQADLVSSGRRPPSR